MKIFLVSRIGPCNYDQYDAFVVTANSEDEARRIHPNGGDVYFPEESDSWVDSPDEVTVECIGVTDTINESKVILASFNAG